MSSAHLALHEAPLKTAPAGEQERNRSMRIIQPAATEPAHQRFYHRARYHMQILLGQIAQRIPANIFELAITGLQRRCPVATDKAEEPCVEAAGPLGWRDCAGDETEPAQIRART